ncbi:MAG: BatA domain-containing protein [Melioribacteraceae bacterium]|nr:BatA domain-containing protein [Melioribacteraceae bacterium]
MTFLNPAMLFGLLAASIPILLHLLNLRKLKKIEFSTVAFLKELQKTKIRKVKIKQIILLILRILIILSLVFAFARPTIDSVSIGGAASTAKTSAIFLVDDSFSMSVITDKGSYLNISKKIIAEILNEFEEGDEVAIPAFSMNQKLDFFQFQDGKTKSLADIEVSEISGSFTESLVSAVNALNESDNFNKELYIFSDFTGAGFSNASEIDSIISKLDERVKVYSFNMNSAVLKNGVVSNLKIKNQIIEKNTPINFSAVYKNQSESYNAVASLYINGKRMAQQNIDSKKSGNLGFEVSTNSSGLIEAFIELEDDDILNDNRSYTALYVPEQIRVGLFSENSGDISFITSALQSSINQNIITVDKKKLSQISSTNILQYDVVVLVGTDVENTNKLEDYFNAGKGLVLFPSEKTTGVEFNRFLASLGIEDSYQLIENIENGTFNEFDKYDLNHPTFANIFENVEKVKLGSPQIYKFLKSKNSSGRNIITLADNSAFLSEQKVNNGSMLLYNIAPVLSWSDFPVKGIFAPLITKQVFYLSSKLNELENYICGDDIYFDVSGKAVSQCKLIKPDNTELFFPPDSIKNNIVKYRDAELSGIYKLFSQGKLLNYAVVNVNPNEVFAKENHEDKLSGFANVFKLSTNDNYIEEIKHERFGSELWRYFLIFAFLLAVIEMLVAKNTKKELSEFN